MRPLVLACSLLITSLAAASPVHFSFVRSVPEAKQKLTESPKRLQTWFSEAPSAGVSRLVLVRGTTEIKIGKTVIVGAEKSMYAEPVQPLEPGSYTLTWKAAGDDGHALSGEIAFTVAPPGRP